MYSLSKLSISHYINLLHAANDKRFVSLRLFNLYAGDIPSNRFIGMLQHSFSNRQKVSIAHPSFVRDFIHKNDFVRVINSLINLACSTQTLAPIYNIGTGNTYTLFEISLFAASYYGLDASYVLTPQILDTRIQSETLIADTSVLNTICDTSSFISLKDYFHKQGTDKT